MKTVFANPRVPLVAIFGSLLALGVALGEDSATALQPSAVLMKEQVYGNFRPRQRILATTATVWCIARSNVSDVDLQNALDWVCGPLQGQGQVNCGPISVGGACFNPDTTFFHSSYAFNEYFRQSNASLTACDFQGSAVISNVDPSQGTCVFTGSNVIVDSNAPTIIGAPPPAASPALGPSPPGYAPWQTGTAGLGFEPSYCLFGVSSVVTLLTYLFT